MCYHLNLWIQLCSRRDSILFSEPFTFLVGAKHTKITIQRTLAQHVSQPLDELMNNGTSRESRHGIAILEHEDLDTFVAFCEYAYTGDYTVPSQGQRGDGKPSSKICNGFVRSGSICSIVPPPAPTPPCTGRRNGHVERASQDLFNCTTVRPEKEDGGEAVVSPAQTAQGIVQSTGICGQSTSNAHRVDEDAGGVGAVSPVSNSKKGKKIKRISKQAAEVATVPFPPFESDLTPQLTRLVDKPLYESPRSTAVDASEPPLSPVQASDQKGHMPSFSEAETIWPETQLQATPEANPAGPAPETDEETVVIDVFEEDNHHPPRLPPHQPHHHTDSLPDPNQRRPSHVIDTSFFHHRAQHPPPRQRDRGVHLWDEFVNLRYTVPRRRTRTSLLSQQIDPNTTNTTHPTKTQQSVLPPLPYLLFHAKLYVFATKYLIPSLAQLCLLNLHKDLTTLSLPSHPPLPLEDAEQELRGRPQNPQLQAQIQAHHFAVAKAEMILDLLHYVYTHTTRLEPISLTSATQLRDNELRWLVVHFAACKVGCLARLCSEEEREDHDGYHDYHGYGYGYGYGGYDGGVEGEHDAAAAACPTGDKTQRNGNDGGGRMRTRRRGLRALLDTTPELASDLIYCLI